MLWLKTMGICLTIAGFGVWGLNRARRYSRRVAQLKDLRMALGFLEKEIIYMHTPLTRAMERTARFAQPPVENLFWAAALHLQNREGATAREGWLIGLQSLAQSGDLNKNDLTILETVSSQLGVSDAAEQGKFVRLIQEELKLLEEQAAQEMDAGQKIWSYGGFILGAVVVLLLL
jgi:stage III sporulation protein AB